MLIGIIGAGRIGSTLAHLFTTAGHEVEISNSRGPDTLRDLETEHVRAVTVEGAARDGELVVVTIPLGRYQQLPAADLALKTVIDTCNYYPSRDGKIAVLENGSMTSSELLQEHLPGAHVVKAFNAMRFDHLREYGRPSSAPQRYGIPVAAGDQAAKRRVEDLIEQVGFEPADAGALARSRTFGPGPTSTPLTSGPTTSAPRIGVDRA